MHLFRDELNTMGQNTSNILEAWHRVLKASADGVFASYSLYKLINHLLEQVHQRDLRVVGLNTGESRKHALFIGSSAPLDVCLSLCAGGDVTACLQPKHTGACRNFCMTRAAKSQRQIRRLVQAREQTGGLRWQ